MHALLARAALGAAAFVSLSCADAELNAPAPLDRPPLLLQDASSP